MTLIDRSHKIRQLSLTVHCNRACIWHSHVYEIKQRFTGGKSRHFYTPPAFNPSMPTVFTWVQHSTFEHSDAQGWASECSNVKNYKWRLNPVWQRILYSCTQIAILVV